MKDFKDFLEKFKKQPMLIQNIPLNFGAGFPTVKIINDEVCVVIPYFRFMPSKEIDKSTIYPIKFVATVLYDNSHIIAFQDLEYVEEFSDVDYGKEVGYFRHDSIKNLNKGEYNSEKDKLFDLYGKMISYINGEYNFTKEEDIEFKRLLNILIEPGLVSAYSMLDPKFYNKYLKK